MSPSRLLAPIAATAILTLLAAGCQHTTVVRVPEPVAPPAEVLPPAHEPAPQALTVDEIAQRDPVLQTYLKQRADAQGQLARERTTKLGDHPDVKRVVDQVERLEQLIGARAAEWSEAKTKQLSHQRDVRLDDLRKIFAGDVDLFLDSGESNGSRLSIRRVQFQDEVDVAGRRMFRFTTPGSAETWLVDPARIVAVRGSR